MLKIELEHKVEEILTFLIFGCK